MKLDPSPVFCKNVTVLPMEPVNTLAIISDVVKTVSNREDFDDAFFVCDLGDVIAKYNRWQKEFPRVRPHYAIKCNPDTLMLKLLIALGMDFDCASKVEIRQMLTLGARPNQIIYANPCKQSSHIRYARDSKVDLLVFDNMEELVKTKKNFPNARLVLRIVTDDSASVCRFSMKYGAHIDACPKLIDAAFEMGFNLVGISFHVGSGCQDVMAFVKALKNARSLFDYAESIGRRFTLLDIGGGFPGTENVTIKFEEITAVVNKQLDHLFPLEKHRDLKIIAEPGRYFAASAFTLATNVIAKRKVAVDAQATEAEENTAFMYYINDGLYGAFNCLFYDHAEVEPTLLKPSRSSEQRYPSSIWGPSCDGLDKVIENAYLPEINVLDWIVWHNMGAYTISASSSFNGFKVTKIRYVMSENYKAYCQLLDGDCKLDPIKFTDSVTSKDDHLCDKATQKKQARFDQQGMTECDPDAQTVV